MSLARGSHFVAVSLLLWALGVSPPAAKAETASADARREALDYLGRGTTAFRSGDFAQATQEWSAAIGLCHLAGDDRLEGEALARRGEAYRVKGHLKAAIDDLTAALALAERIDDKPLIAAASGALGNAAFIGRRAAQAEPLLQRSLEIADQLGLADIAAAGANDLGNLYAATNDDTKALRFYQRSVASAERAKDVALTATARINAARILIRRQDAAGAEERLSAAVGALEQLPPSYGQAIALLAAGSVGLDSAAPWSHELAYRAFRAAQMSAQATGDASAGSLALGNLGRLYETNGRAREALDLTNNAVFLAQRADAPELLYRWEWQRARLDLALGHEEEALEGYRRSVASLRAIRQDIPVEYRDGRSSFRELFGPLYQDFAALLLHRSAKSPGSAELKGLLVEARDAVEQLKATELQDYFRDACVVNLESRQRSLDEVLVETAAIYPVILPDRIELLVSFGDEQRQVTVKVDEKRLTQEVTRLRTLLEKRTTREFAVPAEQLYRWLITPLEQAFAGRHIGTLVFVPDGVLRTIPMAALFDGSHFLIEKYAVVTAPSLKLVDPRPLARQQLRVLVAGVSESVQGFPALPNVVTEMRSLEELKGSDTLYNEGFRLADFEKHLETVPYTVVHIASHGEFGGDPSKTFVLTFDGKLTMDELERTIKFGEFRDQPLELLTLSACRTAAGDDRAALGLAGIAIKSGARSALASLWYINDQASSQLVVDFYKKLEDGNLSKAEALRKAQVALLDDRRFRHPGYWAPFVLIGNWL